MQMQELHCEQSSDSGVFVVGKKCMKQAAEEPVWI